MTWISVKNKLPPRGKKVHVKFNSTKLMLCTLLHTDWHHMIYGVVDMDGDPTWKDKITHWFEDSRQSNEEELSTS